MPSQGISNNIGRDKGTNQGTKKTGNDQWDSPDLPLKIGPFYRVKKQSGGRMYYVSFLFFIFFFQHYFFWRLPFFHMIPGAATYGILSFWSFWSLEVDK